MPTRGEHGWAKPWLLTLLLASLAVGGSAAEVAGVRVDDQTKVGGAELELNGAGLRKKLFFSVYVAGLYLPERRTSTDQVLALAGPKRLSITLMRTLPPQKLVDAMTAGIRDNSSPEEEAAVKGRIEELGVSLLALRQANRGDVITFDWLPDAGTRVALNGAVKGNAIPGEDVYRALLKVWLGDKPTSAGLKRALLGQDGR